MAAIKSTGVLSNISVEKTVLLIELYERHECLWNITLSRYRNPMIKKAAWTSLRRIFTERTGIECTDENIQKKMLALRNNYTRELRIARRLKKSGFDAASVRTSKWPYFNALSFLGGLINISTETTSNLGPATSGNDESHNQDEEDEDTKRSFSSYESQELSQSAVDEQAATPFIPAASAPSRPVAATPSRPVAATPSRPVAGTPFRPYKRKQTEDTLQSCLCQSIEDRFLKPEDPIFIWAKNVGSTLNLIKNERRRILARMEVEQVLHKYLREELSE